MNANLKVEADTLVVEAPAAEWNPSTSELKKVDDIRRTVESSNQDSTGISAVTKPYYIYPKSTLVIASLVSIVVGICVGMWIGHAPEEKPQNSNRKQRKASRKHG